ncbi:YjjG family noncanonical pyrimidine nucleotidase [Paenibacillus sp. sgz500958]|uniref:YjjG family noncanonical pyrimidine nucleotidase n=1 Tax=Paenibacillus sp. sgz500958 TaxID=3242475 RepID=UPI0036D42B51
MKYELILFDADDTLFDYEMAERHALHSAFEQFGYPAGAAEHTVVYKEINKALWRELELGLISSMALRVERFRRLFATQGLELEPEVFSEAYLKYLGEGSFLIPGAVELCGELDGLRLAIITNGIREVQTSRIQGSLLCNTFEQVIISEEAGCQKPEKGIFDYAFNKLGLTDKDKVLIVGDSLTSDIQGGINYGIDTCWYNPRGAVNASNLQPTYEIRDLSELLAITSS